MADKTKTTQEGNIVSGSQAGRDVNDYRIIYNLSRPDSPFSALMEKFRAEEEADQTVSETVATLQHFLDPAVGDPPGEDLKSKLIAAGRQEQLEEALRLKELFYKLVQRNLLRAAAQTILASLLGRAWILFNAEIRPLIDAGESAQVVDAAVYSKVVNPLVELLGDAAAIVQPVEVAGMVYYLTGNCHIRWDG